MTTPVLICIGGPPGVGKTTVGHMLRQALPGSVLIDPDEIRLELLGRPPGSAITAEDLAPAVTARTIEEMKARTEQALSQGRTVIVPSAFILQTMREDFEQIADKLKCRMHAFWLQAGTATITRRQQERASSPPDLKGEFSNASQVVTDKKKFTALQGQLSRRWQVVAAEGAARDIASALHTAITGRRAGLDCAPQ